jgi:putative DNA primase/helicase
MFDAADVKTAARGRWREILAQLGVDPDFLRNTHGPCPGCGGKDRFRFDDREGDGTFICSQGGGELLSGDGFTLLQHVKKWDFAKCATELRRELHVPYITSSAGEYRSSLGIPKPAEAKPKFADDKLAQFAARWRPHINTAWLADRSAMDPAYQLARFLLALYVKKRACRIFMNRRARPSALA